MRKDYYIYLSKDIYLLATREDNVPANKIAARVSLSQDQADILKRVSWSEYQDWLEYYFTHGQKLVTT
jgi:hypothetical protein